MKIIAIYFKLFNLLNLLNFSNRKSILNWRFANLEKQMLRGAIEAYSAKANCHIRRMDIPTKK